MKYERITERVGRGVCVKETSSNDNKSIWNAIERLAELEDKIENGTLVELPCIIQNAFGEWVLYFYNNYVQQISKVTYSTEEKAKQKLKELEE